MAFNDAQKMAIRHREGPMLVLAGPGSGKTTVITNRVRYLTEDVYKRQIFLYETGPQEFKVSMRSQYLVDVSRIAAFFGGGGHVR